MNLLISIVMAISGLVNDTLDYDLTLFGPYDMENSQLENGGYIRIYTIFNEDSKPKYLLYIIKSEVHNEMNYDFKKDEKLFKNILVEIKGDPVEERKFKTYTYEDGIVLKVNIESGDKIIPGYLFYSLKDRELFRLLFMSPNKELYKKYQMEFEKTLNSFKIL